MSRSHRHHFLPEFYLKGFTNDEGMFAVYGVQKKVVKKNWHSTKSHFYVMDHNSAELNGVMTDIPEQLFSILDGRMASIFQKIQSCPGVPKLTLHEMIGLYYFLSNLFWRNPENDIRHEKSVDLSGIRSQFDKFRSGVCDAAIGCVDIVLEDKDLIKLVRPLAGTDYVEKSGGQNFKEWRILYSPNGQFVCSDQPFIALDGDDVFGSPFVVPLTKHHLLIKCSQSRATIPAKVVLAIQLALVQQAKEFCACPDKALFQAIKSDPSYYSIDFLKDIIFGYINGNYSDLGEIFGESESRFFTVKIKV